MGDARGPQHDDIIELLVQHGALSVSTIKEIAATAISVSLLIMGMDFETYYAYSLY